MAKSTKNADTPPADDTTTKSNVVRVKYTGPSVHVRVLEDKDFRKGGLEGVGKKTWHPDNLHVVEFEDPQPGLIEFLTESELVGSEFKVLEPGQV